MNEYGYLVLFLSLLLGIMVLPIPIEAMMGYAGFLSFQGQLNWYGCVLAATTGCSLGMVLSYWIGNKLGMPFLENYGRRFHFGPDRFHLTTKWLKKYNNKLVIISLFIPGVRHLTGYFAGVTGLPLFVFSVYSFLGSFIWASTFILLGKMLGPNWVTFHELVNNYLITGSMVLAILIILIYLLKNSVVKIFK
jgi:membrane protein DedA with SNARE-associated domain